MHNERILVIDDDTPIRNGCAEFLRSQGYEVQTADSGETGLELLQSFAAELVITDFKMPGIDGLEVLRRVKEARPKTDVIVITAYGTIENAVEAMKRGAYDYLTKNFDLDELDLTVKRCLEKQRLSAQVRELKELVNLYEASKAIGSLMKLDELLDLILRLVSDTLSADGGSLMLYDPAANELEVKAALGQRRDMVIGKRLALGERIAGYAAQKEQPVSLHGRLADDPRFGHLEVFDTVESSVTVPLERKGRLLGVINLHRRENGAAFSRREEELLSIFAVEASIAIENSHLFNSLAQEKEELDAVFSGMADGAVVTDPAFRVVRRNQMAEELLGIVPGENSGKTLIELLSNFEPSIPWDRIQAPAGQTASFELTRRKGKSLILGARSSAVSDADGNLAGYILVLRNITEEKLQERQKMEFLSIISHKFKTPLTSINGFASLMADRPDLDEGVRNALRVIKKGGDQLNLLVDNLLRFSLLTSEYSRLNPQPAEAHTVVKRCLQGLCTLMDTQQAKITVDPGLAELPPVYVDVMKMIEVLQNLVENAIKFNAGAGKTVHISGRRWDGQFIVLEVTDNGQGIPSEEQRKIFQKFYQIDEYATGQIEGAGLGLALVQRVVESHGGKVWVKSAPGEGSTFSITLPLFTPSDEPPQA